MRESLALCVLAGATLFATNNAFAAGQNLGASIYAYSGIQFGTDDYVQSENGKYQAKWNGTVFAMERLNPARQLWASWSWGTNQTLTFQTDGNLVLKADVEVEDGYWESQYNWEYGYWEDVWIVTGSHIENQTIWHTGTSGYPGAHLVMQDDSNLVLYNGQNVLWMTGRKDPRSFGNVIGDRIYGNTFFQVNDCLMSEDERYMAIFQADGNFVLYRTADMRGLWASNTENRGANMCVLQGDGNLVVYRTWQAQNGYWDYQYNDYTGEWESVWVPTEGTHTEYYGLWHTATHGNPAAMLIMQNDGNLVIYNPNWQFLWNTGIRG